MLTAFWWCILSRGARVTSRGLGCFLITCCCRRGSQRTPEPLLSSLSSDCWLCQPADVPLFDPRGVRLLQLKLGHLLHLLNLAPLSAPAPPAPSESERGFSPPAPPLLLSPPADPCSPPSSTATISPSLDLPLSASALCLHLSQKSAQPPPPATTTQINTNQKSA